MEELHINGIYKHKKGNEYLAKGIVNSDILDNSNKKDLRYKGIAKHSETLEEYSIYEIKPNLYIAINATTGQLISGKFVLYKALYGNGQLWIRPYKMFLEPDRFKFMGIV